MAEILLEKEPVTEPRDTRTATAMFGERFTEGMEFAKKLGKTSSDAAERLMEDTTRQIKRHPAETVIGAFAIGILFGGIIGFAMRRK
jgi:hypothetical protein